MNVVILIGNLTKDVELKSTPNNKVVTRFTLAVNRDKENVDYVDCVAWEKTAELIHTYCQKGSKLGVEGTLRINSTQDKEGRYVKYVDVLVNSIEFLSPKKDKEEYYEDKQITSDDLPF